MNWRGFGLGVESPRRASSPSDSCGHCVRRLWSNLFRRHFPFRYWRGPTGYLAWPENAQALVTGVFWNLRWGLSVLRVSRVFPNLPWENLFQNSLETLQH